LYETSGQSIDILASTYGTKLGADSVDVKNDNVSWTFKLPEGTVASGDSSVHLGLFPETTGLLSSVYGNASVLHPSLLFYFHELDSAGNDSATFVTILSDTLHMYLEEQPGAFDRSKYFYLSQLSQDSLVLDLDVSQLLPMGDTLTHIIKSELLLSVGTDASSFYVSGNVDSIPTYYLEALDKDATLTASLILLENGAINDEIGSLVQNAINDSRESIELVLKSNHRGFDPGFMALDTAASASSIYVHRSLVVRP